MVDLSQTFQDAIDFTRSTGVEYIWIDSLCIIQDSEEDWLTEAANIGNVYKYGWCNVAATEASKDNSGLFKERSGHEIGAIAPKVFQVDPKPLKQQILSTMWGIRHGTHVSGKHASKILSPGLWIAVDQACEFFPTGLPRSLSGVPNFKKVARSRMIQDQDIGTWRNAFQAWSSIIRRYNQCELTFEKDKLIAIAGLARKMKDHVRCRYLAGLWEDHLLRQLLWNLGKGGNAPKQYQAPSWSWASTIGPIVTDALIEPEDMKDYQPLARIVDVNVETVDVDEMSSATGGYLRISARLIPATLKDPSVDFEHQIPDEVWIPLQASIRGYPEYHTLIDKDIKDEEFREVCYLVPVSLHDEEIKGKTINGIVVRSTELRK